MKTRKPLSEKHSRNQPLPKAVQPLGKRFRHRDRGIHVGRVKGA
ncbi:hypothetical protein [Fischerella sp.]|nr:hypothetical protein [Fischerella sp.]